MTLFDFLNFYPKENLDHQKPIPHHEKSKS